MVCCINEWFIKDISFRKDFEQLVKIEKFISLNASSATGTRRKAIEKFRDQGNRLAEDLIKRFKDKFSSTPFILNQQVIKATDISGSTPTERFNYTVERHLSELYKKNHLANSYAKTNEDLKKSAGELTLITDLTEAEILVNTYIDNMDETITVTDVVNQFQKSPYGWKDLSTIDILIKLFRKGKRKFEWHSDIIDINTFVEKAIKQNERSVIVIKPSEAIDKNLIRDVKKAFREIFNEDLKEDNDAFTLFDEIKRKVEPKQIGYTKKAEDYGKAPFGKHFNTLVKILTKIVETRDQKALFDYLIKFKEDFKNYQDKCKEIEEFLNDHSKKYYDIKEFTNSNQFNFESLEEIDKVKGDTLIEYFNNDDMPGDRFPLIHTIHKELSKGLQVHIEDLKRQAEQIYDDIFKNLEIQLQELEIKEPDSIYQSKEFKFNTISTENKISNLKLLISQAPEFRAQSIKSIYSYKAKKEGKIEKESVVFEPKPSIIQNEEQLDSYLEELKANLIYELKLNKIIIIK